MATIDTSLFPSATFKVDTGEAMPVTSRLNALRESQMGDIKFRQAQQEEADNMLLRQAYNAPDPVNFLAQQGRGDLVPAVKQSMFATQEAESKLKTQNLAYDKAHHERIDQLIGDVTRYTTADQANSALDSMLEKGEIDPQTHSMYRNIVVSTPWPQAKTQILDGLRTIQEQFESMQPQEPKLGTYQPGDYTTASWAKFTTSKNPADLQLKPTTAASTTVNLPPQELAESKAFGEQLVKDYSENIKPAADQARKSLNTVDVLQNLLDKGLQTGWGTELEGQARSALARMGVEGAKDLAGDIQTFKAFVRQNVLNEQMKQKGVQTEGDAQRIEETFARLGNTTESNRFLLDVRRAQLNRDIAQQKFWNDWKSKHGTFDGAENAWLEGEGSKSLFDAPTLKKYKPTEKPAAAPAGVKAMPTGAKLKTYADQHFNGDQVKAKAYLTSQGYK